MNPLLNHLKPYPFARLREAMQGIDAPEGMTPIHLQSASQNTRRPKSSPTR